MSCVASVLELPLRFVGRQGFTAGTFWEEQGREGITWGYDKDPNLLSTSTKDEYTFLSTYQNE